ncbi:MAG: pyruvate kinase, partial [Bacteroidota bacterium]|nr:pyruvate kinase [Bacteroidota bacterium]
MAKAGYQNTKVVATVGPACSSYNGLLELAKAGVDVFRLNFSHGTHQEHLEVINHIVDINQKFGFHCGTLADLQGPKIRIGNIEEKEVMLHNDAEIVF